MAASEVPNVSREQLLHLLGLGCESTSLDYKASCDLQTTGACVEIAKDIAAMQIDGGYIVVGVDDGGAPEPGGISEDQVKQWDEAYLRGKVGKYLAEPLTLHTKVHEIDSVKVAIVHVGPHRDGLSVIRKDGTYPVPGRSDKVVFRAGDVFARHGTSSERWTQDDIARILAGLISVREEQWRARFADDMRMVDLGRANQGLASGPITNYTWKVDADTFDLVTLELFRAGDDIALRHLLVGVVPAGADLLEADRWDEIATLTDRLSSFAANALIYRRPEWFDEALDALHGVYRLGFDDLGNDRDDLPAPRLWLLVIEHVLALGAVAVRSKNWSAVERMATYVPGDRGRDWRSWLRHGLTTSARSGLLDGPSGSKSLLTLAQERIAILPALRSGAGQPNDALTNLCQFDLLAALALMAATGQINERHWYPNFANFFTARCEPAIENLLADPAMRQAIFPLGDDQLAGALRLLDQQARRAGSWVHGWDGYVSPTILEYLQEHS